MSEYKNFFYSIIIVLMIVMVTAAVLFYKNYQSKLIGKEEIVNVDKMADLTNKDKYMNNLKYPFIINTEEEFFREGSEKVSTEMEYDENNKVIVLIKKGVETVTVSSAAELVVVMPFLKTANRTLPMYAQLVNYLATAEDYELIQSPGEFEEKYRAAYEAEDPDENVAPGVVRLHNFGIPNFSTIKPPSKEGDNLIFFAENLFTGLPYKGVFDGEGEVRYEPVGIAE